MVEDGETAATEVNPIRQYNPQLNVIIIIFNFVTMDVFVRGRDQKRWPVENLAARVKPQ